MPNTPRAWQQGRTHAAVDIYAARGAMIVSPVSGTIKATGSGNIGGHWVQVQGDDGNVYYFAHMDAPPPVSSGQRISGGQQIGAVGTTGSAQGTSPHLHFSIKRDGTPINPVEVLRGAVLVPEFGGLSSREKKERIESGGRDPIAWQKVARGEADQDSGSDQLPPWIAQLEEYRNSLNTQPAGPPPRKLKARRRMAQSLSGMAQMVRRNGFDTGVMDPSGVDDNTVPRESVTR